MRWEERREVVLGVLALLFLGAYAWPILDPGLDPGWERACRLTQVVVWVAFGADFALRVAAAPARARWVRGHLLELALLVLPVLRPLRLLVLLTLLRAINRGGAVSLRGRVGVYVGAGSVLVGLVAALSVLEAERGAPGATITGFGDAVWWACTTMTTVGYGDTYPVTPLGRTIGVGLMVAGVALLGAVTATAAAWLVQAVAEEEAEEAAEEAAQEAAEEAAQVAAVGARDPGAELLREVRALRAEVAALRGRPDPGRDGNLQQ
ncbi:pH-gated potassium channel KcsA [Nocardioides aquaticus]|uniref:PH-gated potassium channel KcsA n=1 Tax=Nocardioides aquaticus TaxID=160826 RepID=A0ABX8EK72_9ACTN|nr:potassium channel family protein [Nocardioides aquaticus]QVT80871.1 pH-gated potassium channel KcsA [Nocardioides aquaticus]